jgi:hypothetical protein
MNSPTMQAAPAQQPVAGLGSLMSPSQPTKGKSPENMGEIMALAQKLSDAQLADVLMGRSLDVPQFAALTEAMGRKSLRTAVQGAQAQQELNQPSLKQQALADMQMEQAPQMQQPMMGAESGLASLPAENMESMDLASGGIIAFGDPELNPDEKQQVKDEFSGIQVSELDKRIWNAITNPSRSLQKVKDYMYGPNPIPKEGAAVNAPLEQVQGLRGGRLPAGSLKTEKIKKATPEELDAIARGQGVLPEGSAALPNATLTAAPVVAAPPPSKARPPVTPAVPNVPVEVQPQGLDAAFAAAQAKSNAAADERYAGLAGAGKEMRDRIASMKSQSQGEGLLNLAAAVMGTPNLSMAASKGLPLLASTASNIRKETGDITKAANDYDLNIAKAKEAAASGNMKEYNAYMQNAEMAKHYANTAKYQDVMGRAALMNAGANSSMANNENKMNIAIGNKVMGDVESRLKNDIRFKNDWSKMTPEQQAAYYQQQYRIASSVYSGKMDPAAFGGPQVAFSKEQTDLLNKYK